MTTSDIKLNGEFVASQRRRLEALLRELAGSETVTMTRERHLQEEHGQEAEEREDAAQTLEQYVGSQALQDMNARRIRDIWRALQKIDAGTYGFSDESGEPIPIARLEAVPEAVLTVEEQGRRDGAA